MDAMWTVEINSGLFELSPCPAVIQLWSGFREKQALEAKLARCRELAKEFPRGSTAQMIRDMEKNPASKSENSKNSKAASVGGLFLLYAGFLCRLLALFETTCRPAVTMSVSGGGPEVMAESKVTRLTLSRPHTR